jgi:hypothetical protein
MADGTWDAQIYIYIYIYIYTHISFSLGMRYDSGFGLAEENLQRVNLLVDIAHLVPGNNVIFVNPEGEIR